MINRHKPFADKAKKLAEDLKRLDLTNVGEILSEMNQGISLNLKTIVEDQKSKYNMIQSIGDIELTCENPESIFEKIF